MFLKGQNSKTIFSLSLLIVTFIALFIFLIKINSQAVFFLDDMNIVFVSPYNWDVFWRVPDHGSYTAYFPNKIIGFYLARFFKLHPQDFLLNCGIYVKSLLFLLIPFFSALFCAKKHIKKPVFCLIFVFLFILIFNSLRFSLVELAMSTAFYRFTFPILLWTVFLFYFYGYSSNNLKPDKKFLIISGILGFLLGNSSELLAAITFLVFLVMFLSEICFNPQKNLSEILKNPENKIYIPLIFVFLGFIMLISNEGFLLQLVIKHDRFPNVTVLNTLPKIFIFLKEYLIFVVWKHILPLLTIFASVFYLLRHKKEESFKPVVFVNAMTFGILAAYFLMFFAGQTHYDGDFWIVHNDLQFILHCCLLIIATVAVGLVADNIGLFEEQNQSSKSVKVLLGLVLISVVINANSFAKLSDKYYEKTSSIRQKMYLYDKMTLFYWNKGERAILPYDFDFSNILGYMAFDKTIRNFSFDEDDEMHKCYMETNYPKVKYHGYLFTEPKTAFEEFKKNGGKISKQEMRDIKFQRLQDESSK
ncbi:MAG: hypothetical protein K6C94_07355 [Candidatus Gastranaerophilales bacterium]|nr:hypothetical protein [Candidatus Gastranaerophilales bacterium]